MINFTEDFRNIINKLQSLQEHLDIEINTLESRIAYLEDRQTKDDTFFKSLEVLIQQRNKQ